MDYLLILNCILITPNSVQCTVENRTSVRYRLEPGDKLGLLHDPRGQAGRVATPHAVFNSMEATAVPTSGEQEEESIDEQIIAGHQLFDPSDLDKRYSYKIVRLIPIFLLISRKGWKRFWLIVRMSLQNPSWT